MEEAKIAETRPHIIKLFCSDELPSQMLEQNNLFSSQKKDSEKPMDKICVFFGGLLLSKYAVFQFDNFYKNCSSVVFLTYGRPSVKGKGAPTPFEYIRQNGREHWPDYVPTEGMYRFRNIFVQLEE